MDYRIFINGRSMEHILYNSDQVLIKKNNKYKKGDIVVFKSGDEYVVHRILFTVFHWCYQFGDNSMKGYYIKEKDILGKACIVLNDKMTNLDNDVLNKKCVKIIIRIMLIQIFFKSKIKIIRKKKLGKYYLKLIEKRNLLQKLYFDV
jgi:hypothetical protein